MDDDDGSSGDTNLFAIFIFAFLLLFLTPATIWRVCSGGGATVDVAQPWQKKGAQRASFGSRLRTYLNGFNVLLLILWITVIFLGLYISSVAVESEPFNPFQLLGVLEGATEQEVKKAYRKLTLVWHPDKHKGEEAKIFANKKFDEITKAYNALTDETARENWIKYGHPDGPQAMSIGVALPEWIFAQGKTAPLVLLMLVFFGLAVPILVLASYLNAADRYVGANKVMEETLMVYHRFCVKEMLRVTKMYEAIVPAKEFVNIAFTPATANAYRGFAQVVARQHDLSPVRLPKWWTPEMTRTFYFLHAYLSRDTASIPPELQKDFKDTLQLVPVMCEEFVKAACAARNRFRRGWFLPAEAAMQFQQCVIQQVKPEILSPSADEKKRKKFLVGAPAATLLQLPGVDEDVLRGLEKAARIRNLPDLAAKPAEERDRLLLQAGLPESCLPEVHKMLLSLPQVHFLSVQAFVEEEDDVKENDILTVRAHVALTRQQHADLGGTPLDMKQRRAGVAAFAPRFPHPSTEKWHVFLCNQRIDTPSTWGHQMLDLSEAERVGAARFSELGCQWGPSAVASPSAVSGAGASGDAPADSAASTATAVANGAAAAGDGGDEVSSGTKEEPKAAEADAGQKLEFKFLMQEVGLFNLSLVLMPSCWLGCNAVAPVSFKVLKQTAAEKAGKGPARGKDKAAPAQFLDDTEVDDEEDDESDKDEDSEGWDSDETGTDITHDDEPEETNSAAKKDT